MSGTVSVACVVAYRFTCSACAAGFEIPIPLIRGNVVPVPWLPEGWTEAFGRTYCARHEVKVRIVTTDGEVDGREIDHRGLVTQPSPDAS